LRTAQLRWQIQAPQAHFFRRLPRPRHSHGHNAERCRRHGRGSPPYRRQRDLPAAADLRASGRYRDHETPPHNHPAEQDRLGQGGPGQGAVRPDHQVRAGHGGRESACHSHLGTVEVQYRSHLRVLGQEGAHPDQGLHLQAEAHHYPLVRCEQARL